MTMFHKSKASFLTLMHLIMFTRVTAVKNQIIKEIINKSSVKDGIVLRVIMFITVTPVIKRNTIVVITI